MVNSFILASISTHKYLKNKSIVKDYMEQNTVNNTNTNEDITTNNDTKK